MIRPEFADMPQTQLSQYLSRSKSIDLFDKYHHTMPGFTAFFWAVFCFSMIFAMPVPIIGLATTTVFAIPHIFYAFFFLRNFNNQYLLFILIGTIISVLGGAIWAGNLTSTYFNFAFWLINAYAAYRMLRHPQGRKIAMHAWAFAMIILMSLRLLEFVSGFEIALFNRNGYGFMFTVFFAPFFAIVYRYAGFKMGLVVLLIFGITVLINASRSNILITSIACVVFILHYNQTLQSRVKTLFGIIAIIFVIYMLLPSLTELSQNLGYQVAWIYKVVETGDIEQFREGRVGRTIELREMLVRKSLELFERYPITGAAFGQYREIRDVEAQSYLDLHYLSRLIDHNSYTLWLAETGLSGVIPLGIFLSLILKNIYQSRVAFFNIKKDYLLIGMIMGLSTCLALNFLANITAAGTWVMWIVVAAFLDSSKDINPASPHLKGER